MAYVHIYLVSDPKQGKNFHQGHDPRKFCLQHSRGCILKYQRGSKPHSQSKIEIHHQRKGMRPRSRRSLVLCRFRYLRWRQRTSSYIKYMYKVSNYKESPYYGRPRPSSMLWRRSKSRWITCRFNLPRSRLALAKIDLGFKVKVPAEI